MQLIRNYNSFSSDVGRVATIGNFDGVHLGHQTILRKIIDISKSNGLNSTLITFEPSAKEFFSKNTAPPRLTNFREKFNFVRNFGIESFVRIRFNQALASMPAEDFIKNILVKNLNIKHLIVGDNFRFGQGRTGDISLLRKLSKKYGYKVENAPSITHDGDRISSTLIRCCLDKGNLDQAELMLGRPYSMSGRVCKGDQNGRTIGFPTANIPIKRLFSPVQGIFAAKAIVEDQTEISAVAYVGKRPVVDGEYELLEVHLFDFSDEIYNQHINVTFLKKLREDKNFNSFDEMKNQIQVDTNSAKEYFCSIG